MRTNDPIPGSPGVLCEGLNTFNAAVMDQGDVAFILRCLETTSGNPGTHVLFWDGAELTKIADNETPLPGQSSRQMNFDDLDHGPTSISLAGGAQPQVLIRSGHELPERSVLYQWHLDTGIDPFPSQSAQYDWPASGVLASNRHTLVWMRRSLEVQPELHLIDSAGNTRRVLSEGNSLAGGAKVDFIKGGDYYFNGRRALVVIDTEPYSDRGWWNIDTTGTGATPTALWQNEKSPISSPTDRSITYTTVDVLDISPSHAAAQSTVALGDGGFREGWSAQALLFSPDPNAPFQVIHETTLPVPGHPEFTFIDFNAAEVLGNSVVFSGLSIDRNNNFLTGIYEWTESGTRVIVDGSEPIEGVLPLLVRLLGRDDHDGGLLIAAQFNPNSDPLDFDSLFEVLYVRTAPTLTSEVAEWLREELAALGDDPAIVGLDADPDGDGVANVLEYALGGNPGQQDTASILPSVRVGTDGNVEIAYARRAALPEQITVVTEVFDPNTRQWIPVTDRTIPSEREGFETVTVTPESPQAEGLYRVRVNHTVE